MPVRSASLIAILLLASCGGSSTPSPEELPPPVCYLDQAVPESGFVRSLRSTDWADLMTRGFQEGGTVSQDCQGNSLTYRPTDRACEVHEPADEPGPRAVAVDETAVVVGRSDSPSRKVVWVITHRFENGDGFGPVGVTVRDAGGVAVRALGTLRLPVERARLRLRETGGQELVVADGERCEAPEEATDAAGDDEEADGDASPFCYRIARIMPLVGDRLLTPEVRTSEGRCLGPNAIELARREIVPLESGWVREFRLAASLEFQGGTIVVHEQVTAEDSDLEDPGRPPRPFRTTDADRYYRLRRGSLQSDGGVPLFERTVRAAGSVQLPVAESERPDDDG
jgi:hypothetical protein